MQTDVLRGYSHEPADPNDVREYIGLDVALDRAMRAPAYFVIIVDPRLQRDQGIFITFTHTRRQGKSWTMDLDKIGAIRLAITSCRDDGCRVQIPKGIVPATNEHPQVDLLDKFLHSDTMLVLYLKNGKPYDTMILLSSFKKEYERVMTEELGLQHDR